MKHRFIMTISTLAASVLLLNSVALAKPNTARVAATNTHSGRTVTIPAHAVEIANDVFHLGTAEVDGVRVEGIMIVDRAKNAKGGNGKGGGKPGGGGSNCFAYLARGAKWKVNEPWVLDPANSQGFSDAYLLSNTAGNIQKWEDAAGADVFGNGSLASGLAADTSSPDGQNEVLFGSIDSPGAIAVTIVWGIFGGPPQNRQLVEWDQVYDEVDFDWSSTGEAGKMDYENIATHEVGHALGMGHPGDGCSEETMYRFASFGETSKRDLNAGDIAGIANLY